MADKKPAYPHPEAKPVGGKRNFDKKPERRFGEKKPEGRKFGEKKFGDSFAENITAVANRLAE